MKLLFLATVYPAQNIMFQPRGKPGKSLEIGNENVRHSDTQRHERKASTVQGEDKSQGTGECCTD